ncbi:MAG TPA: M15 family metallopeptidase [Gaiellaceae bacterium]|nr:M15 family metallopeptidase [Gaiellaceae bacterium]
MVPRIAIAGVAAAVLAGTAGAGTRAAPPFTATVTRATAAQLHFSYRHGCPVGPAALRHLRLAYWGFDGRRHLGTLVVATGVTGDVVAVFRRLYRARFPIRRIRPIDAYRGSDDRSMAADNTSAFNCRRAVASGPPQWSAHAYGEAIDVNPLENPYVLDGKVRPPRGARYADRANVRPGMAVAGGVLVRAFAAVGWQWGGRWTASPDYQHFSSTGA